jgi:pyrimidine-specific ribonucleoside hydrolase
MRKIPIIIDCDPGLDDAIALFVAFESPEFDIRAITTVAGNQTIEKVTKNALQLVEVAGKDILVAKGARVPLFRDQVIAAYVHGENGLKTTVLPEPKKSAHPDAIRVIYEEALKLKGELVIVAVGPLTNLAQAFMVHPDLKDLIKKIVIMGGGHKFGNITPAAEFNIFADPEAAKIVFEFGVELVMVGLDVTMADGLTRTQVTELFTHHNETTRIIEHILLDMVNGEGSAYKPWAYIHDAMALMYLLYDDLLEGDYYHVDLETKGHLTYGKTVVDYYHTHKKNKNAWVAFHVNSERFHQALKERLSVYEKR